MSSWQNSQDRRGASSDNISVIQKEFTKQAPVFENQWNQRMKRSNREIMDWVLNNLGRVSPHTRALDVASGTGIFARTLAPICTEVVALDATEAMLIEAKSKAEEEHLSNIKFTQGNAAALPFPDSSFGLVVSRLAVHHFTEPMLILDEMARVTSPDGQVVLVDLVASEDEEQEESHNRLERLRDPSHTRALSVPHISSLLSQTGLSLRDKVATLPVDMDLENWLESTGTNQKSREKVWMAMETEVGGGAKTGMNAHKDEKGRLCFTHTYALLVGRKATI